MMVFEYAANGNLRDFLRAYRLLSKKANDRNNNPNAVENMGYVTKIPDYSGSASRSAPTASSDYSFARPRQRNPVLRVITTEKSAPFPCVSCVHSPASVLTPVLIASGSNSSSSGYGSEPRRSESGESRTSHSSSAAHDPRQRQCSAESNAPPCTFTQTSSFDDLLNRQFMSLDAEPELNSADVSGNTSRRNSGNVFTFPTVVPSSLEPASQAATQSNDYAAVRSNDTTACVNEELLHSLPKRFKFAELVDFALQIARGLDYLSERKVSFLLFSSVNFSLCVYVLCYPAITHQR